jgi:hypothetical protein
VTLTGGAPALVNDGSTYVDRSIVTGNSVNGSGGAIVNNAGTGVDLQVNQSTVSDNHASSLGTVAAGGAIWNAGLLLLSRTTVTGNSVSGTRGSGGGIYNNGTLSLLHATLNGNSATSLSLTGGGGADVFNESGKTAQTQDSIYGSGCNVAMTPVGAEGRSFSSDATCTPFSGDLKLGPLQDNGGGTDTEMLLPGSVAIDAYTLQCDFDSDQRGVRRPQGTSCDSGAYELVVTGDVGVAPDPPSVSVTQGQTVPLAFRVASSSSPVEDSVSKDVVHPVLTDVLPDGLSFAGGSPGCSASGQTVTCDVGAIATNASPGTVTIDVRADAAGTFQDPVDVSSPRPDTNQLDDHATVGITSTAPPVQPPAGGAAAARVRIVGKPKIHGDRLRAVLACSGAQCAGRAALLVSERVRHGAVTGLRRPAATARARTVSLASKRFSIAAGRRATLSLRLSRAGRRLLARFHRLPVRLRLALGTSKTTAASAAVVFKRRR